MTIRKPGRDAEAAREAIMNAAEAAFAQAGFAGARIDGIAASAGYNKSLIFHYFEDKLGLYRAVVGRLKEAMLCELADVVAPYFDAGAAPTAAQVEALTRGAVRWLFDYYRARPHMLRIISWEAAEGWSAFTQMGMERDNRAWAVGLAQFLSAARDAGVLRPESNPELLITTILSLTHIHLASLPHYHELFPHSDFASDAALEAARDQIVGLVLHGAIDTMPKRT